MKNKKLAIGLLVLVVLLGIGGIVYAVYNKPSQKTEEKQKEKEPEKKDPLEYGDTNFNLKFVKTVNSVRDGNYLVSPYSVEIALGMLKEGANGESAKQILENIGERKINDVTIPNKVGVANAVFIREQYKEFVAKTFTDKLQTKYDAEVIYDEFLTPAVINNWVKEKTKDMIDHILDDISQDFVLGIADAIAIDVEWYHQFECISTLGEEFTKIDGSKMKVEMMHQRIDDEASYFETDNAKGVILPYHKYDDNGEITYGKNGRQLEFVGILPNGKANEYVEKLTEEELKAIDANKQDINSKLNLSVSLPRFSYEFDLKEFSKVLQAMGIKDVFDSEAADLTGLMTRDNMKKIGADNLYVSVAIHKTFIDLNEKGTKAAAVTYFGVDKNSSISIDEPKIVKVDFDKSFVYMIRDVQTKEVLFFGLVDSPNEWKGSTCSNEK
jgi:serpin B